MIETPKMRFRNRNSNWDYPFSFDGTCLRYWPCIEEGTFSSGGRYEEVIAQDAIIEPSSLSGPCSHPLNGAFTSTVTPSLPDMGSDGFVFVARVSCFSNAKFTYGNVATGQGFEIASNAGGGISYKGASAELNDDASGQPYDFFVGSNTLIAIKNTGGGTDAFHCYWGEDAEYSVSIDDISTAGNMAPTAEITMTNIIGVNGIAIFSSTAIGNLSLTDQWKFGKRLGRAWVNGQKYIPGVNYTEKYAAAY